MKKTIFYILPVLGLGLISCGNKSKNTDVKINSVIATHDNKAVEVTQEYNDNYFSEPSSNFNIKRMRSSFVLSNSSVSKTHIASFLTQAGYSNIYSNDAYDNTTVDSIGYTLAYKEIGDDTIINCTIRGFDYKFEWYSNFKIGESGPHTGFNEAKNKVLDGIIKYINDNNLNEKELKFWITGYSRGGAVSNLVTKSLDQYAYYLNNNSLYNNLELDYDYKNIKLNIDLEDIYCDTFEAPNVDTEDNVDKLSSITNNIFNAINPDDWIPKIPSFLKKHGIEKNIALNISNTELINKAKEFGINDIGSFREVNIIRMPVSTITQNLYFYSFDSYLKTCGIKDRETYYNTYESSISYIMSYFISLDPSLLGNVFEFANDNPVFLNEFNVNSQTELILKISQDEIKLSDVILKYLDYNQISYDDELVSSFTVFDALISNYINNDNITKTHVATLLFNYQNIIDDHYAEINYSYLLLYKG